MDEGARLHQRTDWFLIFHGILLEAFFAAPQGAARFIVGILGFLTSYLWFMTGYRHRWIHRHLGACMGNPKLVGPELSGVFERIFQMRRKGPQWVMWAMPVSTFAVVIPFAFTAAWFSLLLWTGQTRMVCVLTAVLGASTIATIWIVLLKNGPDIPQVLTDGLVKTAFQDPQPGNSASG